MVQGFNRGFIFLKLSLELVVVVKVAILAFAFSINKPIGMWASVGVAVSAKFVVAVIAHALGVMLLVFVRTLNYFHCLALNAVGRGNRLLLVIVTSLRITIWF